MLTLLKLKVSLEDLFKTSFYAMPWLAMCQLYYQLYIVKQELQKLNTLKEEILALNKQYNNTIIQLKTDRNNLLDVIEKLQLSIKTITVDKPLNAELIISQNDLIKYFFSTGLVIVGISVAAYIVYQWSPFAQNLSLKSLLPENLVSFIQKHTHTCRQRKL